MGSDIKASYALVWRFAPAFPLIFLIPPLLEFAQHVIEWRLGIFDGLDQAEALAHDPVRLGFGHFKLAALLWVGLWISRFVESGGDRAYTRDVSGGLMLAFVPVVIVSLAWDIGQRFLAPWIGPEALGQTGSTLAGVGVFAFGCVLQVLLAGWRAAVPLRDRRMGLPASIWRGLRCLGPGLAIYLAVFLPLLVVHTAFNVVMSLVGPGWVMWTLFVIDSLLVGVIATALWGAFHAIYRRGLAKAKLAPLAR